MEALIVILLIAILIGLIVLGGLLGWNIWLTYKTLVRPEAPCYAANMMMPRMGLVEVDPSNPSYGALSKMIAAKKSEKSLEDPKASGTYI